MVWQMVVQRLRKFIPQKLPPWRYMVLAVAMWALLRWLGSIEIIQPLRNMTEALLADLQVLSPLNVISAYYHQLIGCGVSYEGGSVVASCSGDIIYETMRSRVPSGISALFWPLIVLWDTAVTVWDNSGWVGRVIYVLTFPVGAWGAYATMQTFDDTDIDDWTPFGWSLLVALSPVYAGLSALLLQCLLIVLVGLFGLALAWIVWLLAVLAGPIAYARAAMSIVKSAEDLEKNHHLLTGGGEASIPVDPKKG